MLEKWALIALISAGLCLTAYLRGRADGAEAYYTLVANLSQTTLRIEKATEKANTARKDEKARTAEVFAGLDLRLSNELPKIIPLPNCAIPDADRIRLSDTVVEAANSTIRVRPDSKANPEKVPIPAGDGLGKEVGT